MGKPKGVHRDFEALERRRLKGMRLLGKGLSQSEVGRRLGVGHASVNRWAQALAEQGRGGLKKAGRAGRKPRWSGEDVERREQGLLKGRGGVGEEKVGGMWGGVG